MEKNNSIFSRLFTKNILEQLLEDKNRDIFKYAISSSNLLEDKKERNVVLLKKIYEYMSKNYRNEYFYQNIIFNNILIGRHSLNTTVALTQIPVAKSKVDLILINGKATVYEIKTELDTFERLENQIKDYYKGFNYVYVVTCEKYYKRLSKILLNTSIGMYVGIYILTDTKRLSPRKKAIENNTMLNYEVIFKYLRKNEFESILLKYYKKLPEVAPVFYYMECFNLLKKIPLLDFYNLAIKELKQREKIGKEKIKLIEDMPKEIRSWVYFYRPSIKDYTKLNNFLENNYGG